MTRTNHGGKPPAWADPPNVSDGARLLLPRGVPTVTFKQFSSVAKQKGWTLDFLAEKFTGKIDAPREFFKRVLTCTHDGEYRGDVVLPYKSVRQFYMAEGEALRMRLR